MKRSFYILGIIAVIMLSLTIVSCGPKIVYELDGGTLTDAPTTYTESEIPDLSTVIPTKEGYVFLGWYMDSEFKTKLNIDPTKSTNTVYAKWVKAYNIAYELNGGVADTELPTYYPAGEELDIQEFTAKKTAYLFYGWYFDEELTERASIDEDTKGDVTLYAKWRSAPTVKTRIPDTIKHYYGVDSSFSVDLSKYFDDKGIAALEYSATSSNEEIATVSVEGEILKVTMHKNDSSADISVTVSANGQSCASDTFKVSSKSAFNIACIGDSLTAVRHDTPINCYPYNLGLILGEDYMVHNFGVSGTSITSGGVSGAYTATEQYTESLDIDADVIIILLGTNDAKPWENGAKESFKEDYKALVNSYREKFPEAEIYLVTSPTVSSDNSLNIPGAIIDSEIVDMQLELAEELELPILDFHEAFDKVNPFEEGYCLEDGVHFNEKGAKFLAGLIHEFIINN